MHYFKLLVSLFHWSHEITWEEEAECSQGIKVKVRKIDSQRF